MNRLTYRVLCLFVLLTMLLAACAPATTAPEAEIGTEARPLINVFVPSVDLQAITDGGARLDALLASEYDFYTKSSVATSYTAAIEAMCAGKADAVWLATLAYVLAHDKCDAQVIIMSIRRGSPTYQGQILVAADSDIETVADLKGKRFAFTDPVSTSGYLYPVGLLKANGVDPNTDLAQAVFAGNHNAAAIALYNGSVDAAATFIDVRDSLEGSFPDIKEKTRVLTTTDPIPNDTITVRSDLPPDVVAKFKDAMLTLVETDEGRQIVFDVYEWDGAVEGRDGLFDPVRAAATGLGIELSNWKGVSTAYKVMVAANVEGLDAGLNKGVWAGVQSAMSATGAGEWVDGIYAVAETQADYEPGLADMADSGFYDLIFAVGADLADAVKAVAPQYPDQTFVLVGAAFEESEYAMLSNVTSLVFAADEPADNVVAGAVVNAIKNFRRAILEPGIITVE